MNTREPWMTFDHTTQTASGWTVGPSDGGYWWRAFLNANARDGWEATKEKAERRALSVLENLRAERGQADAS